MTEPKTYPNGLPMGDAVEPAELKVGDRVAVWRDQTGQWEQGAWWSATVSGFRDDLTTAGPKRQTIAKLDVVRGGDTTASVFVYRARRLG